MNRVHFTILLFFLIGILSCDTSSTVEPRYDNFFIKLYGGEREGNQFGADIIGTADGSILIAGTSISDSTGLNELLLIKADQGGNLLWRFASDNLPQFMDQNIIAKSVLELRNSSGYIVGGTIGSGSSQKSILMKFTVDGTFVRSILIDDTMQYPNSSNKLSKITQTRDYIIVSGSADGAEYTGSNAFIAVVDEDLAYVPETIVNQNPSYINLEDNNMVAGAYEFDTADLNYTDGASILLFASELNRDLGRQNTDFVVYEIKANLDQLEISYIPQNGDQIISDVARIGDEYVAIGESRNLGLRTFYGNYKYDPIVGDFVWNGNAIGNSSDIIGKGVSYQTNRSVVFVGDLITSQNTQEEIFLGKVSSQIFDVVAPWPKYFGNVSSAYRASAVTTLGDGSILMVGTADLEPIKKIIVIKTGPNGEMNFE